MIMRSVSCLSNCRTGVLLAVVGLLFSGVATSHELEKPTSSHAEAIEVPVALKVSGTLSPPSVGTTDLKFHELFKLPVGPRGLVPSDKLIGLNGKQVRMVGYMAKEENPTPGMFILSPLPVNMGDEDESFADDLPASAVFVHMGTARNDVVPYLPGLIKLTGVLQFGAQQEADGRISTVRILLDPALALEIMGNDTQHQTSDVTHTRKESEVVSNEQVKLQQVTTTHQSQSSRYQEKQL
jgi:hypothetical protein